MSFWWTVLWVVLGFNVLYLLLEGASWLVGKLTGRSIKDRLKAYLRVRGVPVK